MAWNSSNYNTADFSTMFDSDLLAYYKEIYTEYKRIYNEWKGMSGHSSDTAYIDKLKDKYDAMLPYIMSCENEIERRGLTGSFEYQYVQKVRNIENLQDKADELKGPADEAKEQYEYYKSLFEASESDVILVFDGVDYNFSYTPDSMNYTSLTYNIEHLFDLIIGSRYFENHHHYDDITKFKSNCVNWLSSNNWEVIKDLIILTDDEFSSKYASRSDFLPNKDYQLSYDRGWGYGNIVEKSYYQYSGHTLFDGSGRPTKYSIMGFITSVAFIINDNSGYSLWKSGYGSYGSYIDACRETSSELLIHAIVKILEMYANAISNGNVKLDSNEALMNHWYEEWQRAKSKYDDAYAEYLEARRDFTNWQSSNSDSAVGELGSYGTDLTGIIDDGSGKMVYGTSYLDYTNAERGTSTEFFKDFPLAQELMALEGLHRQNPETGAMLKSEDPDVTYISEYTNRIFGAPFQLLDSVDRRFEDINPRVGNEYLRNFLLNSPILHIKPGMPIYTGGTDPTSLKTSIQEIYMDTTRGGTNIFESIFDQFTKSVLYNGGSKLQRRMYGFREAYYDYMQCVNYMCRSMAVFLDLTSDPNTTGYPNGIFVRKGENKNDWEEFKQMNWEDYRMLTSSSVISPADYLNAIVGNTFVGAIINTVASPIELFCAWLDPYSDLNLDPDKNTDSSGGSSEEGDSSTEDSGESWFGSILDWVGQSINHLVNNVAEGWKQAASGTAADALVDKICSVQFMVEPGSYTETISNRTEPSAIENAISSIGDSIGAELAFIGNTGGLDESWVQKGISMLGSGLETAVTNLSAIMDDVLQTQGWMRNLIGGAVGAIKGQKMIYPEIYKSTTTSMQYEFTINLSSPYGDVYNYYTNIVVPLMHIIGLAAPRMVSANSTSSPYLVQAFIPGMCTCQLGIVESLNITKNPNANRVSVNGYPLDIQVKMTVKELYNALSISPANDPTAFLFNETLNDYMSNLAGLIPSIDTYTEQRKASFAAVENYWTTNQMWNDISASMTARIEDWINPFIGR